LPTTGDKGLVRRGRFTLDRNGDPESITIDVQHPSRALTTFHEIGHFLDLAGIGAPRGWESLVGDGALAEWRELVLDSRAVGYLANQSHEDDLLIAEIALGALEWPELWARSYVQYVVNRAGDLDLVAQLDVHRVPRTGGIYLPLQWDDDDFVVIDQVIEEVFRRLGWRSK